MTVLSRAEIAHLIPHAGTMCLLDTVDSWDDTSIRCRTSRHRASDNPLRQDGRLGATCAVEFAAQAMAVHGRLAGAVVERPRAGYLASLRELVCRCARLDTVGGDLVIEVWRLIGDDAHVTYRFTVGSTTRELVSGRATVILLVATP
jgi:predicted hotdog family 3-hydroxylacyl-ACP dehydratase